MQQLKHSYKRKDRITGHQEQDEFEKTVGNHGTSRGETKGPADDYIKFAFSG